MTATTKAQAAILRDCLLIRNISFSRCSRSASLRESSKKSGGSISGAPNGRIPLKGIFINNKQIHKYMESNEKINVRGTINSLEIGETVAFPRALYLVSSIRAIAGAITADTRKIFTVSATDKNNIVVTRTA